MFVWELVPAAHDRGQWLATATLAGPIALAAPGVPLAHSDEDLDCWRWAAWDSVDPGWEAIDIRLPREVRSIELVDVVDLVDPAWHPWVEQVTATLLERVLAFRDVPLGDEAQPDRVREQGATSAYVDLLCEARRAFRSGTPGHILCVDRTGSSSRSRCSRLGSALCWP